MSDTIRDTIRALPYVALIIVLMVAVYFLGFRVWWGAWPPLSA